MKMNQLQSVYSTLQDTLNIPTQTSVESANRYSPISWNPTEIMIQFPSQNDASFQEQTLAVKTSVHSIDKYCGVVHGRNSLTYTKNIIVHGAPGSGKSYVAEISVLYAISQGLRVLSTCLTGTRANAISGINIHPLFCIKTHKK